MLCRLNVETSNLPLASISEGRDVLVTGFFGYNRAEKLPTFDSTEHLAMPTDFLHKCKNHRIIGYLHFETIKYILIRVRVKKIRKSSQFDSYYISNCVMQNHCSEQI